MKQQPFEDKHQALWQRFELILENKELDPELPGIYRKICHHLAIARTRNYSAKLVNALNELVMQGHQRLYSSRKPWQYSLGAFFVREFPVCLYRNRHYFWAAMALFFIPLFIMGFGCFINDELILSLLSPEQLAEYELMYDPSGENQKTARGADSDWMMFGYYINNNISIGFQSFASGIFAGVGSIFILVFNGIMIGAVAGHMTLSGYSSTFYPFVIGHGSFELVAIALSGAAGIRLGFSIINPRSYRRVDALRLTGQDTIKLVYGVFIMLLVAAFLEAFWSSAQTIPSTIKYIVGAIFWLLVLAYFIFCSLGFGAASALALELEAEHGSQ